MAAWRATGAHERRTLIKLTRLDGSKLIVNCDLIETIESTHDTVLVLTTQKRLVVHESPDQIVELTVQYKRRCFERSGPLSSHSAQI